MENISKLVIQKILKKRMFDLQIGCSEKNLYLGALIRLPNKHYAFILEQELHNILKNYENVHVKGEWYDLLNDDNNQEYDLLSACFTYCAIRVADGLNLDIDEVFSEYYDNKKRLLDLVEICYE
ncbi:GIY-YIG nuclease family protein [Myxosarcina sp. GI1]|uniref:GIY-YIG nuclease family protein n=1 Tax=Myxosarcina sp. GI1 TaxID=1541065 RepID=UPI0005633D0B|nr:GIY-YIG nuclease family protein [Myxosarcina sp. GI1]